MYSYFDFTRLSGNTQYQKEQGTSNKFDEVLRDVWTLWMYFPSGLENVPTRSGVE